MISASTIRLQVESRLESRIPSALTPAPKMVRPVTPTGIECLDALLQGGLPRGTLTELVGPECSGRTSAVLSSLAQITAAGKVCAWIDVSNALDPGSAAAMGVDLKRLLWVRCHHAEAQAVRSAHRFVLPSKLLEPPAIRKGLHGGGFGAHPRSEGKGISEAVGSMLRAGEAIIPRCSEPIHKPRPRQEPFEPSVVAGNPTEAKPRRAKQYDAMEQALRSTDLLLQTGGFSAIVLDMGGISPEYVSRVELSTWHRYRLAAERTQSIILLLTQYACARSSAELQLRMHPAEPMRTESTVFTGIQPRVEVVRQRFTQTQNKVVPLRRPPQRETTASWQSRTVWSGWR